MNIRLYPASQAATVAIVGCGFSGTMVALHLARQTSGRLRVLIFERGERLARGTAYGTASPEHLLNVPARLMSAWPDEPEHFLDWLRDRDPATEPGAFVPRQVYGDYLEESLRDATAHPGSNLFPIRAEVVDLVKETTGRLSLITGKGARLCCRRPRACGRQSRAARPDFSRRRAACQPSLHQ